MLDFLLSLLISILLAYGISVALVEKSDRWPLRKIKVLLQLFLRKIHWKLPQALYCIVCTSFWSTFLSDSVIFILINSSYFFFPFSGLIVLGLTWTLMETVNALESV